MTDFETLLTKVLRRQISEFRKLLKITRLTSGASRITFEVLILCTDKKKRLALRLNPTDENTDGLMSQRISPSAEAMVMKQVGSAGVPAPKIIYILRKSDKLGEGYLMEWMKGESIGSRIVKAIEFKSIRPTLAAQCGHILAQIHAIDISSSGLKNVLETMTPKDFVSRQYAIYQSLQIKRPMIDYVARWLMNNLPISRPPCLVHNDFRNGNLLIDAEKGITGVLDWEITHIGNPVRDIGWLCTKSWRFGVPEKEVGGFGSIDDLLSAYVEAGGLEIEASEIRFWKVFGSFWWAIACMLMEQSYGNGNDKSLERPVIGRRVSESEVDCANILMPGPIPLGTALRKKAFERNDDPALLSSVRDFLTNEVAETLEGRTRFLAKVAANSLSIAIRERKHGREFQKKQKPRLENLLGGTDQLSNLRSKLASAIAENRISLENEHLKTHLRETAFCQILIDQPSYHTVEDLVQTTS